MVVVVHPIGATVQTFLLKDHTAFQGNGSGSNFEITLTKVSRSMSSGCTISWNTALG